MRCQKRSLEGKFSAREVKTVRGYRAGAGTLSTHWLLAQPSMPRSTPGSPGVARLGVHGMRSVHSAHCLPAALRTLSSTACLRFTLTPCFLVPWRMGEARRQTCVGLSAGKGTHPKAGGVRSEARWALTPCFSVPCRTLFVLHWATGPQPATSNPGTLLLQGARLSLPDRTAHSEHAFMPHALAAWPCILHSAQPQPAQPRSALLSGSLPSQPRYG